MRRAHTGQLFGLLLIPTPVFWVFSTPQMGGWDGAIWDDFSSWTFPFLVGYMDRPLPTGGYGLAGPFLVGDMDRPVSLTYCPLVHAI